MKIASQPRIEVAHEVSSDAGVIRRIIMIKKLRGFAASGVICFGTIVISTSPTYAKSKVQAEQETKECNDKYKQDRARRLALRGLTEAQKSAQLDVSYEDFVACMKDKGLLSLVPKRPVEAASTPSLNKGTSQATRAQGATDPLRKKNQRTAASPEETKATKVKAPKKEPWAPQGPRQTGSHLP